MRSADKQSFKVFESIRDDYVIPFLSASGFRRSRKDEYEQLRDDTVNGIRLEGHSDRRGDYCRVEVYLSVGYRQAGELLAEHLGKKKAGIDRATLCTNLHRIVPSTTAWDIGLDDPNDWGNLLPEKDPAVLGPILVNQLKSYALPFFDARSGLSVVLDPSQLKPDGPDYERHRFLKPACLWVTGSQQAAIELLKAREAEFDEKYRTEGLLKCAEFLEQVRSFRIFLEQRGA